MQKIPAMLQFSLILFPPLLFVVSAVSPVPFSQMSFQLSFERPCLFPYRNVPHLENVKFIHAKHGISLACSLLILDFCFLFNNITIKHIQTYLREIQIICNFEPLIWKLKRKRRVAFMAACNLIFKVFNSSSLIQMKCTFPSQFIYERYFSSTHIAF